MKAIDIPRFEFKGFFGFDRINTITGEVLDSYEDHNVIVLDAKSAIIRAISQPTVASTINKIKLGNDIGTGTNVTAKNPEPAQQTYDETTMSVVFDAPYVLNVGFDSPTSVTFNVTIVGKDVMAQYPNDSSKTITSAALHTGIPSGASTGKVFAYKRFTQTSISSVVDLNIKWAIQFS